MVALGHTLSCLQKCRKWFCVTGAILLQGFQKMSCIFGCVHLAFTWQAQHFRRVILRVFATCVATAASSGDNLDIAWHARDIVRVFFAWHAQDLVWMHPAWKLILRGRHSV